MINRSAVVIGVGSCLLLGCAEDPVPSEEPYRDAWRVAAVVDFVHTDADGTTLIPELAIGGSGTDNFANRGDVIVKFDGPADTMTVELRRFVPASTEASALEQMEKIELWAYEGAVVHPDDKDPAESCLSGWRSGCEIRVLEDALTQREVSGADIRVTLPPDFRGKIDIETEDDTGGPDYFNRSDVCIEGLPGSADVEMQSGRAWVRLADDASSSPLCPQAQIQACEAWTTADVDGQPVSTPWASECPCIANGHGFGGVNVRSRLVDATDITVDLPTSMWTRLHLRNRLDDGLDRECVPEINLPPEAFELAEQNSEADIVAFMNFPGIPAKKGLGYQVALESGKCGPVAYSAAPEEFMGPGNGDLQPTERRGFVEVCSDCIPKSCDVLVP